MKRGEWVAIVTLAVSFALTLLVYIGATPAQKAISGYGLTAWVALAALLCSAFPPDSCTRRDAFLRAATANGWLILMFCAEPWGAVLVKGSSLFTTMFPVTAPPAILTLCGSRKIPYPTPWRYLSTAIFGVAAGNLLLFFPRTSPATHLFLAFFTLVSGLNAHDARRRP